MPESQLVKNSEQKSQDYLTEKTFVTANRFLKINGHPLRSHLSGSHQ